MASLQGRPVNFTHFMNGFYSNILPLIGYCYGGVQSYTTGLLLEILTVFQIQTVPENMMLKLISAKIIHAHQLWTILNLASK